MKETKADKNPDVIQYDVVCVSYEDLLHERDLTWAIDRAFGRDGLGIIAVANVPELDKMRHTLLPLAHKFAHFPESVKKKYESKDTCYSFGWSHGKENLQGRPDYSKGSYYNNPQYNRPVDDEQLIKQYPSFIHPNIWPTEELPELEPAFMALGQRIVDAGLLIAKQCDSYIHKKCPTYATTRLHDIIKKSHSCKARLLHYFSVTQNEAQEQNHSNDEEIDFSSWCGWHNDHGSLTGLVQAIYTDQSGQIIQNPDPQAGLYIKTRHNNVVKARVPEGHLIFQIGESAQVHSGGILQATPHAVRGPRFSGVNRETLAVFMEPDWNEPMSVPDGLNATEAGFTITLHKSVPSLSSRWHNAMSFAQFTEETLAAYY